MNYSKIIKLAYYFKEKDFQTFKSLLKLASSDMFLSMVLGSYRSVGGPENEIKLRRRIVAKMINDRSDVDSTILELARIIKRNSYIRDEDHSQVWREYLTEEQISELEKLLTSDNFIPAAKKSRVDPRHTSQTLLDESGYTLQPFLDK